MLLCLDVKCTRVCTSLSHSSVRSQIVYFNPGGALGYNDKVITYREYANSYYRDFFDYTRAKRSENVPGADAGLIMSRPVDCLLDGVSKVSVLFIVCFTLVGFGCVHIVQPSFHILA